MTACPYFFSDNELWKKRKAEDWFDVTVGSDNDEEISEYDGIYILLRLSSVIYKNNCVPHRDDSLLV